MKHKYPLKVVGLICLWLCGLSAEGLWGLRSLDARVDCAAISADGKVAVFALNDGRVLLNALEQGGMRQLFAGKLFPVSAVAINGTGSRVSWSDYDGNVYTWAEGFDLISKRVGVAAIGGLALRVDGTQIIAAGDGTFCSFMNGQSLSSLKQQTLSAEQVGAMGINVDASKVALGDHSGKVVLIRRSGTSYSTLTAVVSTYGIRHILVLPGTGGAVVCADDAGELIFLNGTSLKVENRLNLGAVDVTAMAVDATGARIVVGSADGRFFEVPAGTRAIHELPYSLDEATVGIHVAGATSGLLVIGESGSTYGEEGVELKGIEIADFRGAVTSVRPSLRSGQAGVVTERGVYFTDLGDGTTGTVTSPTGTEMLAIASMYAQPEPLWFGLFLDMQDVFLSSLVKVGIPDEILAGWTPTLLTGGVRSSRIALGSGDGSVVALRLNGYVFGVEREWAALPSRIWSHLDFVAGDEAILQWGPGSLRVLHLADGGQTDFLIPDGTNLVDAIYRPDGDYILYATDRAVYRLFKNNSTPLLLCGAGQGEQVVSMQPVPGLPQIIVEMTDSALKVNLGTLAVESLTRPNGLRAVFHAQDGPFSVEMDGSGGLALSRMDESPLVAVFPRIIPLSEGGMDTGFFGILSGTYEFWFEHAQYGWGIPYPDLNADWFWFASEGWLAGGESFHPYFYSFKSDGWCYSLLPDLESDWVWDYASGGWRRFGK